MSGIAHSLRTIQAHVSRLDNWLITRHYEYQDLTGRVLSTTSMVWGANPAGRPSSNPERLSMFHPVERQYQRRFFTAYGLAVDGTRLVRFLQATHAVLRSSSTPSLRCPRFNLDGTGAAVASGSLPRYVCTICGMGVAYRGLSHARSLVRGNSIYPRSRSNASRGDIGLTLWGAGQVKTLDSS